MLFRVAILTLALPFAVAGPCAACSIPVFRYALERWPLAIYDVHVLHRGPLSSDARAWMAALESLPANVAVTTVNLDRQVDAESRRLWARWGANQTLPCIMVRSSEADQTLRPACIGPLSETSVRAVVDSPLRRLLVQCLASGDAAVFVLLTSGDHAADSAAAQLLERELARLEKAVALPAPTSDGPQLLSSLPVRVAFRPVLLSRHDAAEEWFVQMLLGSEPNLAEVKGPIVLPVFGRGRLLCSLHGDNLNAEQIGTVARFLCGACSCQVKELNPGVDLLLVVDWQALLAQPPPAVPRQPLRIVRPLAMPPELQSSPFSVRRFWLQIGIAVAAVMALFSGAWVLRGLRQPKPASPAPENAWWK